MTEVANPNNAARRDQLIRQAQSEFLSGQGRSGMQTVQRIVEMGFLNWDLLERAWTEAETRHDINYMDDVLALVDKLAPGFEHGQLFVLRARREQSAYEWEKEIPWLHKAQGSKELPQKDRLYIAEAQALERLFRPEEALRVLDREFRGEDYDLARQVEGACLQQLGRHDQARAMLEQWLPDASPNRATAAGHRLLGHLLDKAGDFDSAWEEFQTGNDIAAKVFQRQISRNNMRWRTEAWRTLYGKPKWVERLKKNPIDYDGFTPVFLVGFPRSGTTLLEQVLDAHGQVQALEEKPMVFHAIGQAVAVMQARARIKGLLRDEMHRKEFAVASYHELPALGNTEMGKLRELYFDVAEHYAPLDRDRVFVDKQPLNLGDIGFILRMFPKAKFIVMLRHPADCVLSCLMQNFIDNDGMANFLDPEHAASFYKHLMALLWQYESSLGIRGRLHYIRYEDMLDDFEGEIGEMLDFIGLDWDDSVTRYYEHAKTRGSLATPSYQGVTQKLYKGSVNRWHNYARQMEPYLHHFRDAAKRYGYSLEMPSGKDA